MLKYQYHHRRSFPAPGSFKKDSIVLSYTECGPAKSTLDIALFDGGDFASVDMTPATARKLAKSLLAYADRNKHPKRRPL